MAIVAVWFDTGICRFCVVSVTDSTTALVVTVYVYVPGAYAKVHDPLRGTGTADDAAAVGAAGVGCAVLAPGSFTGPGAVAGGTGAHAMMSPAPNSPTVPFSLIVEPWRERCHRPVSRVLYARSLDQRDGHFSRRAVARAFQQPTRGVFVRVDTLHRLFGLAPTGVCHAARVATCAVSSYLAVSPLPAVARWRFAFCCTFRHSARLAPRAQVLPGSVSSGARTFLGIVSLGYYLATIRPVTPLKSNEAVPCPATL